MRDFIVLVTALVLCSAESAADIFENLEAERIEPRTLKLAAWREASMRLQNDKIEESKIFTKSPNLDPMLETSTSSNKSGTWFGSKDPTRWKTWWPPFYAEAMYSMSILNQHSQTENSGSIESHILPINIPIFVMNLAHRPDRRNNAYQQLKAVGFVNISFPLTTHWRNASADLILQWKTEGMVSRGDDSHNSTTSYEANAVDQLLTLKRALAEGHAIFGIFEDDIAPAAIPVETNRRIHAALAALPPDADMLYLEYCSEDCDHVRYSPTKPALLAASHPACAAAILFTRQGAAKVLRACLPVWDSIDAMYRRLIANGALEAYLAHPAAFLQDRIWGSDASARRHRNTLMPHHLPSLSPLCNGIELVVKRLECSAVGRPRRAAARAAGWDDDARAVALRPADLAGCALLASGAPGGGAALVVLYIGGGSGRFDVEIGNWPADAPPDELTVWFGGRGQAHVCEAELVLEGPDGEELGAQSLLLLFHPALS